MRNQNITSLSRRKFLSLSGATGLVALSNMFPTSLFAATISHPHWDGYTKSIVIDGLSGAFNLDEQSISHEDLAIFRRSGISAINATIPYPGDNFEATKNKIKQTQSLIQRYASHFRLILSSEDILRAQKARQIGIIMGFQSTEMFEDKLDRIEFFAKSGVRIMQLTYNNQSQFGDGGLIKSNRGLTSLGLKAIAQMESSKVLIDLSHAGQRSVADAIKHSNSPLTISHTGCNAIYRHPRNNDDTELRAVAEKGGVVGIYLMPFLEGGNNEITAEAFMKHLDHAINVCGEDHVSIGSDQGIIPINDTPEFRERIRQEVKHRIKAGISAPGETPNRPPFIPQLNSELRMDLIATHMKKRGYSDKTIEKIIGLNLFKLYQRVWK